MTAGNKEREASWLPSFYKERKLKFVDFRFVYINPDYLEHLHSFDSEVFFSSDTAYSKKPHFMKQILINCVIKEFQKSRVIFEKTRKKYFKV